MTISNVSKKINHNKTSIKVVVECLAVIQDLHPNWKLDDPQRVAKLWHYSLEKYSEDLVKRAVLNLASNSKYVPKLSDVINEIEHSNKTTLISSSSDLDMKRLDDHFLSLTNDEILSFKKKVQDFVIDRQGELNEIETIYAQVLINLINKDKELNFDNDSIKRYLKREWC